MEARGISSLLKMNAVASPTLGAPTSLGASHAATLRSPWVRAGVGAGVRVRAWVWVRARVRDCARPEVASLETRPGRPRPAVRAGALPIGRPVQGGGAGVCVAADLPGVC